MITSGDLINFIKDIVQTVKKHLGGQAEKKQKDISEPCSTNLVQPVSNNQYSLISNITWDNSLLVICFLTLVSSRFLEVANFTPLLAVAIMLPYFTTNKFIQYFLPVSVLFITDLFIGIYSIMFIVYANFLLATLISIKLNKYLTAIVSVFAWHITVNGAVYLMAGNTSLLQTYIQAIPFDFKLLVSTLIYVGVLDLLQKSTISKLIYNK